MLKLLSRRVLVLPPLVLAVALCSFFLVRIAPGDYFTELSANPQISEETISALREQYAPDRPWYEQFAGWMARVLRGDFGYSFACNCQVSTLIGERVLNTTVLALAWAPCPRGARAAVPRRIRQSRQSSSDAGTPLPGGLSAARSSFPERRESLIHT